MAQYRYSVQWSPEAQECVATVQWWSLGCASVFLPSDAGAPKFVSWYFHSLPSQERNLGRGHSADWREPVLPGNAHRNAGSTCLPGTLPSYDEAPDWSGCWHADDMRGEVLAT